MTESAAYSLERALIAKWGRYGIDGGILLNVAEGVRAWVWHGNRLTLASA
jgi:hypothetical protein